MNFCDEGVSRENRLFLEVLSEQVQATSQKARELIRQARELVEASHALRSQLRSERAKARGLSMRLNPRLRRTEPTRVSAR